MGWGLGVSCLSQSSWMSAESYFFALSVVIVRFGAGVGARAMVWLRRARLGFNVNVFRNFVNGVPDAPRASNPILADLFAE